ncbi:hypothetical protein [Xenorhabdus szentirmaii]|nr:hypothetical protein [Xenorhabdus szentirmaii]PHM43875.1 hypothetical protein Xszus_03687 [Xenorhabdus szentirmaii]
MVNCSVWNEEFEDEAELEQHTKEKHRKKKIMCIKSAVKSLNNRVS